MNGGLRNGADATILPVPVGAPVPHHGSSMRAQLGPITRQGSGLDDLLVDGLAHSAEFPDVLANHLPMILVALDRMGASTERLAAVFDTYRDTNGLVAAPPPVDPMRRDDWVASLGDRARETDARAFFTAEVARLGIRDAIAAYLPTLAPGVAGSALHPLMRLAYGVLGARPAEVGAALGYWSSCYLPLPQATGVASETHDPGVVLARVAAMPSLRGMPTYDHLWHGIRATAADPAFAGVVDWLAIDRETPGRIAATALALYAATMDFAALHAVTGAHWVRLVSAACDAPLLMRSFWQAVAALVPSIGFPTLPSREALETWRHAPCPDWPTIMARAIASDDEHDISLVFSASEEEKVYGDRLYRVVAARRIGLIS